LKGGAEAFMLFLRARRSAGSAVECPHSTWLGECHST
jgi:hypothetical protein